jgi:hypothetical protein
MSTSSYGWPYVDLAARLADLKEEHYRQLLAVTTLIELLVDKGLLTEEEIRAKAAEMEAEVERYLPI